MTNHSNFGRPPLAVSRARKLKRSVHWRASAPLRGWAAASPLLNDVPVMRHRWDPPLLWWSPIAPWLWQRQTAGLELLNEVFAYTPHVCGLLDGNAPTALGVHELLFIFPAPD